MIDCILCFRIEPYPDSSLKVEWFRNDKPLPFGNRWRTSYDFGFAALDIIGSYAEDSGRYTLRAKNVLGSAESHIDVKILRKFCTQVYYNGVLNIQCTCKMDPPALKSD